MTEIESVSAGSTSDIREVTMNSETTGLSIVVPVIINNILCNALIDSASQVTVLSDDFVRSMKTPPTVCEQVKLKGVGPNHLLSASYAKNVQIELAGQIYIWDVYIAPITDPVILGLDFMVKHKAVLDVGNNTLSIGKNIIHATIKRNGDSEYNVSRVFLEQNVSIPPNSVMITQGCFEKPLQGDYILQSSGHQLTLIPAVLGTGDNKSKPICLVNDTDVIINLKKKHLIGIAEEIDTISPLVESDFEFETLESGSNVPIPESEKLLVDNDPNSISQRNVRSISTHDISENDNNDNYLAQLKEKIPEHLQDLFSRSTGQLTYQQSCQLAELFISYYDIFAKNDTDLGCFDAVKHKIDTGDARPIKQRMRRTPLGFESEEEKHLRSMLDCGVIRPSASEWSSPPVLVRKKDGGVRWCIDYRSLNKVTVKDVFPLPLIEECLDTLSGTKFFSTLDMASGYWQIEIDEADRHKTAFITKYGLYEHTRMGFGLCNAPATFQRAVQLVLRGLTWRDVLAYLDDIIVVGSNFDHHLANLEKVFIRFRQHNLKLKPRKCVLLQTKVKFLGKIVSEEGVAVNPDNVTAVKTWPIPRNTKEVETFLGFVNYHRDHIKDYAKMSSCLYKLTGKNAFIWNPEHQEAFQQLQHALITAPVLAYPTPDDPFILDTDASDHSIGSELLQIQDGVEKVISYGSFVLTPEQRRYCTTRKELLAVVKFTRQFRHYLLGRQFTLRTDHNSLTWLTRFKLIEGQLARWLEELSQYNMIIVHRPGNKHSNADGLSRRGDDIDPCNCYHAGATLESLPCGGCNYCTRAHNHWSRFEEDVDDVVPLAVRVIESFETFPTYWGPGMTKTELRDTQLADPDLAKVISWLESEKDPSNAILTLCGPDVKYYWIHKNQLLLKDDVLFYKWQFPSQDKLLFVVPTSLRRDVLNATHDSKSAGHLGFQKTLCRLKSSFIWRGMSKDCQTYVSSCNICSINKKANIKAKAPLGLYHAGAPMERVHIDILGPLQPSLTGNKYILMIIDQFTKWVECIPLATQTADVVARAAVNNFFTRFGVPLQLHSDQGKNFESNLFAQLCECLEITKTRTTPYRPASNGQVERYNRTLLQLIRCFLKGRPETWDEYLPQLAAAIRSTVQRQTGFTPNKMMLGREVTQPIELMLGTVDITQEKKVPSTYVDTLSTVMKQVHNLARQHLQSAQERQKRDYDLKLSRKSYMKGDLVYKLDSTTKIGQSSKLKPVWRGPLLVTEVISSVLYRVRDQKKEGVLHHDRLKLCKDRDVPLWIQRARHKLLDPNDDSLDQPTELDKLEPLGDNNSDPPLDLELLFSDDQNSSPNKSDEIPIVSESINTSLIDSGDQSGSSIAPSDEEDSQSSTVWSRRERRIKTPKYLDDYTV